MYPYSLEFEEVYKNYGGIQVLKGVSLKIEQGAIVGLTGPNGAGKTTLFDIISGLEKASCGDVKILGTSIRRLSVFEIARLGVRRTFQNVRLFEDMTVEDNVLVACVFTLGVKLIPVYTSARKVYTEWAGNIQEAHKILASVDLLERRDSLASCLSHGQRRLLELCRAMVGSTKLLLLDEPTAGVFKDTHEVLVKRIHKYRDEGKGTVVVIGHEKDVLKKMCDYVVRLEDGQIKI